MQNYRLVYSLYGLAQGDIATVEGKWQAQPQRNRGGASPHCMMGFPATDF